MKIIHIVPAAFNYFDDIKHSAFGIIEKLADYGIESKIITLQYGVATKQEKGEISGPSGPAPSYKYHGLQSLSQAFQTLSEYDIIHLHCPFLGAAGKIISWQKKFPNLPVIITYYREVKLEDFLSVFISLYNTYYLPKIFSQAKVITCFSEQKFKFRSINRQKVVGLSVEQPQKFMNEQGELLTENVYEVKLKKEKTHLISVDRLVEIYSLL